MLVDDELDIRIHALQKISECRKASHAGLRRFQIPKLNFNSSHYTEMIQITESPTTLHLQEEELKRIVIEDHVNFKNQLRYPCHTQAVERHVKIVTEPSQSVCGYEARQSKIMSLLSSRKSMPRFETKSDYVVSNN